MILPNAHHKYIVFIYAFMLPVLGFGPRIVVIVSFCDANIKHSSKSCLVSFILVEALGVFAVFRIVAGRISHN